MDRFFPIDLYQALSYLLPGLALFIPIYFLNSGFINSTLKKLGTITSIALAIPISISVGIFLHALSTIAQFQIETALARTVGYRDMIKSTTMNFAHYDELKKRLEAHYKINLTKCDHACVYTFARSIAIKDGGPLKDRAQFFTALSVFCRSLILVAFIVGGTAIWRRFGKSYLDCAYAAGIMLSVILLLIYSKEMYFRLSIDEILRTALLLTIPKNL